MSFKTFNMSKLLINRKYFFQREFFSFNQTYTILAKFLLQSKQKTDFKTAISKVIVIKLKDYKTYF